MIRLYYFFLILLSTVTFPSFAEQAPPESPLPLEKKLLRAISDIANSPRKAWSVTVSNYENEEGEITSSIEQFTPNKAQINQWSLVEINGEVPTSKQIKSFNKRKNNKDASQQEKRYKIDFNTLIKADSFKLLEEKPQKLTVGFLINMDNFEELGEDAKDKLAGKLIYDKTMHYIEKIIIFNTEEFDPMFSATISKLLISFDFIKLNNAILPKQVGMEMKGSFAFFTQIDEVSTTTFSNYQFNAM